MEFANYSTQNDLIMKQLLTFYKDSSRLERMLGIINGDSQISLRIVDWFATNYSKKYYTVYDLKGKDGITRRFKVYNDYKLKLKAYQKKRFDPFCRWERIVIPYKNDTSIQTTIGQLNFFKWAIENQILDDEAVDPNMIDDMTKIVRDQHLAYNDFQKKMFDDYNNEEDLEESDEGHQNEEEQE